MKLSLQFTNAFVFVLGLNFLCFSQQVKSPISNPSNSNEKCGFKEKHQQLLQNDANYALKRQQEEIHIENFTRNPLVEKVVLTIPVVIHIIHKGEAVGTGTNISTAQIQSAIDNLNTAYSNGAPYNGVNTDIQFCLAQRDPSGNPHTGINRVNGSGLSGYTAGGIGTGGAVETSVKALSVWDNTRYYNFWIVSEIDNNDGGSGTQGYAYFPGAGPTVDGAVMLYNAFGYDPTGALGYNLKSYTNRNATPIHEVGHALNLYHTFEGDGSGSTCPGAGNLCGSNVGDCVGDTPPHKRSNSDCLINTNDATCNNVDRDLYVHNFMDYSSDVCQSQFTANQATRMTATLTSGGLRASLTSSNGCNPVFANDVSISNIVAPTGTYCFTTFSPQVSLKNVGTSVLTSATITYNIDGGSNQVFSWTGNLSSGSSEIVTLNSISTTTGTHTFNATSTLPNGLADQYTPNNLAAQTFTISSSLPLPFVENFEETFPPINWTNTSEDGATNDTWDTDGYKMWEKRTTAGNAGSTFSAGINNFNNAYVSSISSSDALITPSIDLQTASAPSLTFKVAYKNYPGYSDSLRVLISTDCGVNFTPIYTKSGATLATNGSLTTSFAPLVAGDWRTETVDLTAYAGNIIKLQFESINQYGNNIFIDNINLIDNCSAPVVSTQPTNSTSCTTTNTSFSVTNTGGGTYQWQENNGGGFVNISNGGIYSNATTSTLNLTGVTLGMNTYQYRCVITNGCGFANSNAALLTVNSIPTTPSISAGGLTSFCSGGNVVLTSSASSGNTWSNGLTTQSITVNSTGNYSVNSTVNSCTSSLSNNIAVTVNPNPIISLGTFNDPISCASSTGSIQITGTGSGNISWNGTSSGNMNGITLPTTISNLSAGTYNITFDNGCLSNTISRTLNDPGAPAIPTISASGSTNICNGNSVTLTSSASSGNLWSDGQTTQSIVVSTGGNFSVTTTVLGCSSTSANTTVNLIANPTTPSITANGPTSFCAGGNVVLSSSASTGNVWSTGETTQSITVNSTGNYSVSEIANGCSSPLSLITVVNVNNGPAISLGNSVNPSTCAILDGSIEVLGSGSGNLTWNGTASGSMNGITLPISINGLGAGNYVFTLNDGCNSNVLSASLVDPILQIPTISANGPTNICLGDVVILTSSASSGNTWSSSETSQSITVSAAGFYSVTVNNGNCSATSIPLEITINNVAPTPTISASGSLSFCEGGSVQLTSSASSGNNWSTGETTQTISVSTSETISVSNGTGNCQATSLTVTTIMNLNPTVSLDPFNAICNTAGTFPLTGGIPTGGIYSLNGSNITDFDPASASIGTNNIIYSITDVNSCTGTATQSISVNDCSGIETNSKTLFSIYPNPTSTSIFLKGDEAVEILSVELRDELGRVVLNVSEISNSTEIDLTSLSNGIYTLIIIGNNFTEIQKIQLLK